jgi:hypothetical protein
MYAGIRRVILALAPLLCSVFACSVFAFPQSGVASIGQDTQGGEATIQLLREKQASAAPTFMTFRSGENDARPTSLDGSVSATQPMPQSDGLGEESRNSAKDELGDKPEEGSKIQPVEQKLRISKPADFNQEIYYRNKLEFSLDGGWLPINIPFPLDIFVGDNYNTYPLKYTLVPIFASLRWQIDSVGSPWIFRGNWDMTLTGSITAIPRGPESHYFSYIMGIRRNFVQRNWKTAPYFDVRLGVGKIDAKGPAGVIYAQGQDLTFTINIGSGVRYNFSPRYAISAGLNFMHISNLDLSESNGKPNWGIRNYGINVYGPMVGIDIQLRRHHRQSE